MSSTTILEISITQEHINKSSSQHALGKIIDTPVSVQNPLNIALRELGYGSITYAARGKTVTQGAAPHSKKLLLPPIPHTIKINGIEYGIPLNVARLLNLFELRQFDKINPMVVSLTQKKGRNT